MNNRVFELMEPRPQVLDLSSYIILSAKQAAKKGISRGRIPHGLCDDMVYWLCNNPICMPRVLMDDKLRYVPALRFSDLLSLQWSFPMSVMLVEGEIFSEHEKATCEILFECMLVFEQER